LYKCLHLFYFFDSPKLSIDYAVMEKSKNITVIPCDFAWTDVGNLETFVSIQQEYNKNKLDENNEIVNIDGKNNIAQTKKKLVSFIGLSNICLIEDGEVIVVAKRSDIEKVKEVQAFVQKNLKEFE